MIRYRGWIGQLRGGVGGVLIALLMLVVAGDPARAADLDEDGLDDLTETLLIDRYRPYYLFDHANDKWPASVLWYIQRSHVYYVGPDRIFHPMFTPADLSAHPEHLLTAIAPDGASANSAINPGASGFIIDPNSSQNAGGEGACARVGCYAHVVPVTLPVERANYPAVDANSSPHDAILIQYWQFFPYNDSQASGGGDHEGDWTYLDVYVSPTAPYATVGFVYHHHGDGYCFPTLSSHVQSLAGLTCGGEGGELAPLCYLEEDNHEWWPWAGDNDCLVFGAVFNDSHDGLGQRYRVEGVKNVGEQFAPTGDLDSRLAIAFNGKWGYDGDFFGGDSPTCITDNGEHYFPNPRLVVAYVAADAPLWSRLGLGTRFHPVVDAVKAQALLTRGGTIRIAPGGYPAPLTFGADGVHLRIEAYGGRVLLGR